MSNPGQKSIYDQPVARLLIVEIQIPSIIERVETEIPDQTDPSPKILGVTFKQKRNDLFAPHPLTTSMLSVNIQEDDAILCEIADKVTKAACRI